jgi:hypothetical protein
MWMCQERIEKMNTNLPFGSIRHALFALDPRQGEPSGIVYNTRELEKTVAGCSSFGLQVAESLYL